MVSKILQLLQQKQSRGEKSDIKDKYNTKKIIMSNSEEMQENTKAKSIYHCLSLSSWLRSLCLYE